VLAPRPSDPVHARGLFRALGPVSRRRCISPGARTERLRLALDAKYPGIIEDARRLLARSFPANPVGLVSAHGGAMFFVSVYSSHLSCLFPQHGPGKKHERPIILEKWQQELVGAAPWAFLRGCIRSDGCVFVNRTDVHRPQPYEYLSYNFANRSPDIVGLFLHSCEQVGIRARVNWHAGKGSVRINRRACVANMLEHVGLKA
jgi:hypothetical protein